MKFVNRMYSKWNQDRTQARDWESEAHRVQLKKRFLDSLSCVFAKAQLRDIILLGQFRQAKMLRHFPDIHARRPLGDNVNNRNRNVNNRDRADSSKIVGRGCLRM